MNLIRDERRGLSTAMIAVLAAVNITDELFKAQEQLEEHEPSRARAKKTPGAADGPLLYDVADIGKARENKT